VKEQYQVEISNRFAALKNLADNGKVLTEDMKASAPSSLCYYELKQQRLWFEEEKSQLLDQRKQAKL
jgi:hypothetical protein